MRKAPPLAAVAALAIAAVWALAGSWGGGSPVGALRTARADREGHSGLEGFGAVREGQFRRLYRDPEDAAPRLRLSRLGQLRSHQLASKDGAGRAIGARRAVAPAPASRDRGREDRLGRPQIAVQTAMRGSP